MKRLFVVHGWDGSAQEPMIAWLGKAGTEAGFDTTVLEMPNPSVPTIDAWTKHLDENVGYVDQDTYFIGHSIGCQAILRYLELNKGSELGGAILIAPFLYLNNDSDAQEDKDIARPWLDRPIDFSSIRAMSKNFVVIFSDNDESVPIDSNKPAFEKALNPKVIVEKGKGHFTEEDGVVDLPVVVGELAAFK
jgi:predicted alpha/beta hydrolase family esterase